MEFGGMGMEEGCWGTLHPFCSFDWMQMVYWGASDTTGKHSVPLQIALEEIVAFLGTEHWMLLGTTVTGTPLD